MATTIAAIDMERLRLEPGIQCSRRNDCTQIKPITSFTTIEIVLYVIMTSKRRYNGRSDDCSTIELMRRRPQSPGKVSARHSELMAAIPKDRQSEGMA